MGANPQSGESLALSKEGPDRLLHAIPLISHFFGYLYYHYQIKASKDAGAGLPAFYEWKDLSQGAKAKPRWDKPVVNLLRGWSMYET